MSHRALAPRHIAARAQSFHRVGAVDRLVYCAAPLEASAGDGYISFIYIARKACRRIAVQGADNNARCAFVEPADAAEHCALPLALQMPGDCVCERVALMVMGRVHREKWRFVDGEQIGVLIYYIYIYIHRLDRFGLDGQSHCNNIARVQAVYCTQRLAAACYAAVDAFERA